jgi:hypothetical protein
MEPTMKREGHRAGFMQVLLFTTHDMCEELFSGWTRMSNLQRLVAEGYTKMETGSPGEE